MLSRRSLAYLLAFVSVWTLSPAMAGQNGPDFAEVRRRAESGDSKAQPTLGSLYEYGVGGAPKDAAEALKWYTKAAEAGDTDARFNLAQMYFEGNGVPVNYGEAAKWYVCPQPNGQALASCKMISYKDLPQGARDLLHKLKCDTGDNYDYGSAVDLNGDGIPEYQFCCRDAPHGPCPAVVIGKIGSEWKEISPAGGVFAYGFPCGLFLVLDSRHHDFSDICLPNECSAPTSPTDTRCLPT